MLSDDKFSSADLGASVDSVEDGETDSGLSNAQDGASAGGDSSDGDDCTRSLRLKLPP